MGFLSLSCDLGDPFGDLVFRSEFVEASSQRPGNAALGYEYLTEGDYVGNGIPLDIFESLLGAVSLGTTGVIQRSGRNESLPAEFNAVQAENGVWMASPNCLTCHADFINGEYVLGLGNHSRDYSIDSGALLPFIDASILNTHGIDSDEWRAYKPFKDATTATAPYLRLRTRGLNPADRLTIALAAHRNPTDLSWSDEPLFDSPKPAEAVPSDVPAWWLMKKKNAMFYTALGQGDFSRISMTASLLTLRDTVEAKRIDEQFPDVLAYINSLEAPEYPRNIDAARASEGQVVFENRCSGCHGTYGENPSYPNLVIHKNDIGTDPALLDSYTLNSDFIDRYNDESWFGTSDDPGRLVINEGYLAPPLDGIWATAPYFHNGSVPDLTGVLDSRSRPDIWKRSFDSTDYNFDRLGWIWSNANAGADSEVYNTSIPGYGSQGHLYGDVLEQADRIRLLEYLKTL